MSAIADDCFYALLIGLLVATSHRRSPHSAQRCFYALLIGLLVATADEMAALAEHVSMPS